MVKVSIVIVCMNNLNNLYPCLDSINKYTTIGYETLVVTYLFTKENLERLKADYPWITIVESNEIRGFSENNNLALKQVKGKYCFIVNDDTFLKSPVIDNLYFEIERLSDNVAILSPNIKYPDGRDQYCGVAINDWKSFIAGLLKIKYRRIFNSPHVNQLGIFQSYNIMGAAFMIKTSIFQEFGFFDETYFFCPEDIALSTNLNKRGYKCYVDADNVIYHIQGGSWSNIQTATMPAHMKGSLIFYSNNSRIQYILLGLFIMILRFFYGLVWLFKSINGDNKAKILYRANINVCSTILSGLKPKDVFKKFYYK